MKLPWRNLLMQEEFWILVFVLAALLLNWPLLTMVVHGDLFGFPAILVYLISVWLIMIYLAYMFDQEEGEK